MEKLDKAFDKKFAPNIPIHQTPKEELLSFIRQREKDLLDEVEKHAKPYLFTKNATKEVMAVPIYWVKELKEELSNEKPSRI